MSLVSATLVRQLVAATSYFLANALCVAPSRPDASGPSVSCLPRFNGAIRNRINLQVLLVPAVEMFAVKHSRNLTIPVCGTLADFLRIFADFLRMTRSNYSGV